MKILYICNDYAGSRVHCNLTKKLDEKGLTQTVYCPVRDEKLIGKNRIDSKHVNFIYSFSIRSWYKYVYHYKVYKLYQDMKQKVNLNEVDLIHAPTLFSDGALAYKAFKEYGIPYIVAVRSTDIDDFVGKNLLHTFNMGRKILINAKKIYFLSDIGKNKLLSSYLAKPILDMIMGKVEVRPNGIERIWHENISTQKNYNHKLCFIGTFLPRKHLVQVIKAVKLLRELPEYSNVSLYVIGGGMDTDGKSTHAIISNKDFVEYLGKINDKKKLIDTMRLCSIFVMPSTKETFGLVYIEALSQNLPIIYTKNDGVDGYFDNTVGIAVNPYSATEIKDAIRELLDHSEQYNNKNVNFKTFDWEIIADKYIADYKLILQNG